MATTYTTNYHLGKQTDHADKFDMDVITDNMDILDEALGAVASEIEDARGTYDTLDDRMDAQDEMITVNRAALVDVVDGGVKNLLDLTKATSVSAGAGITYTLAADGTLTVTWEGLTSGKTLKFKGLPYISGTLILSGVQSLTDPTVFRADVRQGETPETRTDIRTMDYGESPKESFTMLNDAFDYVIRIDVPSGESSTSGTATLKPMICTKAAWDISHTCQPHRPSEDEQNAQITQNTNDIASNGLRVVLSQQANSSTTYTYPMKTDDFSVPYSCGCYMLSIITWGTTPTYSLYSVAYSGNHTDYTVITKIAGSDANVSVSGDTISVTSSGKVTIMAMR